MFKIHQHLVSAQAILFDLDGTLVQSTGSITQIMREWAYAQGLDATAVLEYCHGKRTIDIVQHFIQDTSVQRHYQQLTAKFIQAAQHTVAIEGAYQLLMQLNRQQFSWAVVSSSERELIEARLAAAGLPRPQIMVSAEDIVYGKPDPEGYLKAATLLNVPIDKCLVFEDAPAGVQAAQQAGAQVITIGQQPLGDHLRIADYHGIEFLL